MGDVHAQRASGSGGTSSPTSAAPSATTARGAAWRTIYSHGEDEFWPEPLLGYVTQANWRKEFAPHLKGKEYMEANCAQCHTEENFAGTPHVNRGPQAVLRDELLRLPQDRRA